MKAARDPAPRHGLVVLAAGASRRLGQAKQDLRIDGASLLRRVVASGLASAPSEAVVVLGAAAELAAPHLVGLPLRQLSCADWSRGMGASLRCGLQALSSDCAGALVLLCDQPALAADHLRALVAAWRPRPERAVASRYAGVLGVPALLPRAAFAEIDARIDRGARDWLRRPDREVLAIDAPELARDLDHPADLTQLSAGVDRAGPA